VTSAGTVEARERLRLFCALRLPEPTLEALAEWQERELGGGRIVAGDHVHITVAFLGSRPAGELPAIAAALRDAAASAARPVLQVRGYRETRSVGMLVFDDEDARATAFAADVHERLERLGVYERERRPWLPHVTVLRFRERPRLRPSLPELGAVSPSEAAVYSSVLRPTGARYEVLESVLLGG
jgi:RNA 2',3'-cyclic 3'-phosphodiesterase